MRVAMRAPYEENPTSPFLSPGGAGLARMSPLMAVGALDKDGRPWTSLWGGRRGFSGPVAQSVIGIKTMVDMRYDPVVNVFFGESGIGKIVREEGDARPVSGLAIDMENRRRVKLMGSFLGGTLDAVDPEEPEVEDIPTEGVARMQFVASIDGSLGMMTIFLSTTYIFWIELTLWLQGTVPNTSVERR